MGYELQMIFTAAIWVQTYGQALQSHSVDVEGLKYASNHWVADFYDKPAHAIPNELACITAFIDHLASKNMLSGGKDYKEIEDLKHDLERYMDIANGYINGSEFQAIEQENFKLKQALKMAIQATQHAELFVTASELREVLKQYEEQ